MGTLIEGGVRLPPVMLWCASGGFIRSVFPSVATEARVERLLALYDALIFANRDKTVLLSGEKTRKSGSVAQAHALMEYVVSRNSSLRNVSDVVVKSPIETFRQLSRSGVDAEVYYFMEEPFMDRYKDAFRLVDPVLADKLHYVVFPVGAAYAKVFSADYTLCSNAGYYLKLTLGYLKALRPGVVHIGWKALRLNLRAVARVGLGQYLLFLQDRHINKDSDEPRVLRKIAYLKSRLRKDLLGEND